MPPARTACGDKHYFISTAMHCDRHFSFNIICRVQHNIKATIKHDVDIFRRHKIFNLMYFAMRINSANTVCHSTDFGFAKLTF